jgi:hypothetical protein
MTHEELTESFEAWYAEEYSHSIKRGARGRAGCHLTQFDGEYISDHARDNFKVWCAAIKRMVK